ncbi:putative mitochondrial protein [Cucumis melo var. makuwa]|uniref:Putative mitochondrial protein n=1 Tax=Cucumis melo var. makuwa TaxID=1194695 RepID=A0A5D3CD14_CUCMM|nr:putative mitochondrial protein [Cucumis melo var. makuwa]
MNAKLQGLEKTYTEIALIFPQAKYLLIEYGMDYEEMFAQVARTTSVYNLLAIEAAKQLLLLQMDVKNAFLNGTLS